MSQTRASAGGAASLPTALINPSRITIVPFSSTSPGLITILPPTKACTPSGAGRKPGGSSSAVKPGREEPRNPARKKKAIRQARWDGRRVFLISGFQYPDPQTEHNRRGFCKRKRQL